MHCWNWKTKTHYLHNAHGDVANLADSSGKIDNRFRYAGEEGKVL